VGLVILRQTFVRRCHNRVARDSRRHVIHYSIVEDTGMIGPAGASGGASSGSTATGRTTGLQPVKARFRRSAKKSEAGKGQKEKTL
jgi:hypothetical protein